MTDRPGSAPSPSAEFTRFVLQVVIAAVVIAGLGSLATRAVVGEAAVTAMLGAVFAATLGSIVGGLPIFMARLRGTAKPQVVMLSMLVRLVVVVLIAAFVALSLELATGPFLVWLALSYLLLLVVDTRYAMVVLRSL